jgi:hypothetical protein
MFGWGADTLSGFLDKTRANQHATYVKRRAEFDVLASLDAVFENIGEHLINPRDLVAPFFLFRSHSAFRGACGTALSGQSVETFVLLRSCLEFAAYCLFLDKNEKAAKLWFDRHNSPADRSKANGAFKLDKVRAAIKARDKELERIFGALYARAIDSGGHPNERAVHGSLKVTDEAGRRVFEQIYLHGDDTAARHAVKSTAEAGLCALFVFQHVPTFTDRFMLLGLQAELRAMRARVNGMFRPPQRKSVLLTPKGFRSRVT